MTPLAVIVLAAGLGTRMKSGLPKVMHKAAGRTLLGHGLAEAASLGAGRAVIVTGPDAEGVEREAKAYFPQAQIAVQERRGGTGHAVLAAREQLADFEGTILVHYGDVPLIRAETLGDLVAAVTETRPLAVLAFRAEDPKGYGRLIVNGHGTLAAIVEETDASAEQRRIDLCNSGIVAARADLLWEFLPRVRPDNAKREIYLTDVVALAAEAGHDIALAECPEAEVMGVNDRAQLAQVEAALQARYRARAMAGGATLIAPETVFFSADTALGRDVVIEPHVVFGPGVTIGDDVAILAFSHIEGAAIGAGARIGPFARLRPGARIGPEAHIGNFVEIKKAEIGAGAKANHLSYIGDARVGAKANIGAGTITCNYDGFDKHVTDIGAGVFVGSNTALVAPVKIGDGATLAAGSVITQDVPGDALAMTRPPLEIMDGWAARYRQLKTARKSRRA